jgi:hypothetical protein
MGTLRSVALTAAFALTAVALAGQDPGYGGMGGGIDRPGAWRERGGRPARTLPTGAQLDGPPLPDFFVPRFELDSGQAGEYRVVYDSFMNATAAIRDSAQAARKAIDAAFHDGDREAARASFPVLQTLGDSLAKWDARFDQRLRSFLAASQLKAYKRWKDEQQRQQETERREEMEQRGGGRRRGS